MQPALQYLAGELRVERGDVLPLLATHNTVRMRFDIEEAEYLHLAKTDAAFPVQHFSMLADTARNEVIMTSARIIHLQGIFLCMGPLLHHHQLCLSSSQRERCQSNSHSIGGVSALGESADRSGLASQSFCPQSKNGILIMCWAFSSSAHT